ncbi:MAG: helix-turn-helix domain-containing protein [Deltaproteobacteria bacterium]|nr:helix-turn-helix domain-containing protein [Deltaproteobacteria bacterium]MBW1919620.1 helix-turn-helix domain-containing protein [Deltaproteobacteria bacterium]MBW1934233.1 helix-turn-helix domain-containing protein [Deltaproteobacteria bacterium]MBW1976468.1 helix-turn-helix domain-containing protein [Deltaproteobacteria bacterium]MBW2044227.1 helix-turn-helix domain-containing protein [Deltaproteobacteria bacterium]
MSGTLVDLGKRIRRERLRRQLTLERFSEMTGLSKSFLSQIERGIAEPSITSLKKIAKQFGFSVVNLFQSEEDMNSAWEYQKVAQSPGVKKTGYVEKAEVVRSDRRKRLALPGSKVMYDLLTPDMNRQLEVMYMRVKKGENSGEEPMLDPPGEKMGIVLKGTLEVSVGGDVYRLEEGDSIYYPTSYPHSWRALEGDIIEVIWILTPPSF